MPSSSAEEQGLACRSVTGEAPKSLATIGDRPFLDILLNQLRRHRFEHVILAVGYQSDLIRSHFDNRAHDLSLEYSIESTPLGTGGASRNAVDFVKSEALLIMNGDSYTDADLSAFVAGHRQSQADLSVLVVPTDGRVDCGLVSVDPRWQGVGIQGKAVRKRNAVCERRNLRGGQENPVRDAAQPARLA